MFENIAKIFVLIMIINFLVISIRMAKVEASNKQKNPK
jgi:hypothetical protein